MQKDETIKSFDVRRIINGELQANSVADEVVVELPFTINVDQVGSFTLLCTPVDLKALAIGFLFTEGVIDSVDDIVAISDLQKETNSIFVRVEEPSRITTKRNLIVTSSCGMCGKRNIEKVIKEIPACKQTLKIEVSQLDELVDQLQQKQTIFKKTGGTHAAGIFNSKNEIIGFGEDLGRHNALDKAIGKCLIDKKDLHGCGVVLSSRISFEMVAKAARAGLEIIIAVSAPSSLAIEAAKKWNIALYGFVRQNKANVYV